MDLLWGAGAGILVGVVFLSWEVLFGTRKYRRWAKESAAEEEEAQKRRLARRISSSASLQ